MRGMYVDVGRVESDPMVTVGGLDVRILTRVGRYGGFGWREADGDGDEEPVTKCPFSMSLL